MDKKGSVKLSNDPKGPSSGKYRVLRGGSWSYFGRSCRSADRYGGDPTYGGNSYGFRVAQAPQD